MEMVKWSDFIPPEYAPVAYGLGAAAIGGGLGWLYDKLRGKKHTARRVGIGALIGALGGLGYGQNVLSKYIKQKEDDKAKQPAQSSAQLREIAGKFGIRTYGKSDSDIKSDLRNVLDRNVDVPEAFDRGSLGLMTERMIGNERNHMLEINKFLNLLRRNRVFLAPSDEIPRETFDARVGGAEGKQRGVEFLDRIGHVDENE